MGESTTRHQSRRDRGLPLPGAPFKNEVATRLAGDETIERLLDVLPPDYPACLLFRQSLQLREVASNALGSGPRFG
jgi:hypothetical protein